MSNTADDQRGYHGRDTVVRGSDAGNDPNIYPRQRNVDVYDRPNSALREHSAVSWGAVLGGFALALVLWLCLNLLGASIGFGLINPATDDDPVGGVGWGFGIWSILAGIIALFCGGLVAGRLSGRFQRFDGAIHGLLTWSLVTLAGFYLAGSAVGAVVSGSASLLTQTLGAVASIDVSEDQQSAQGGQQSRAAWSDALSSIRQEARELLRDTGNQQLAPERIEQEVEQATDSLAQTGREIARDPGNAREALNQAIDRLSQQSLNLVEKVDQQAIANVVQERTNLSEAEAQQVVSRWVGELNEAKQELQELKNTAAQQAAQLVEDSAGAAFWTFLSLICGAAAALFGGVLGARQYSSDRHRRHAY